MHIRVIVEFRGVYSSWGDFAFLRTEMESIPQTRERGVYKVSWRENHKGSGKIDCILKNA